MFPLTNDSFGKMGEASSYYGKMIKGAERKYLTSYNIFGNSVQVGTPTPENPIEINSVGKKEGKFLIRTMGKNLFDGSMEAGSYNATTGAKEVSVEGVRSTNMIDLRGKKLNTNLTLSRDGIYVNSAIRFSYFDKNNLFLSSSVVSASNTPSVIPTNAVYVAFHANKNAFGITEKIQVEFGNTITKFEPFIEVITEIVSEPLRSTPDGTRDDLDSRNIRPMILNGTEVWNSITQSSGNVDYYYIYTTALDNSSLQPLTIYPTINCDRLKVINYMVSSTVVTTDTISLSRGASALRMLIRKERIDIMQGATLLDKLKRWLASNPITLEYALLNPIPQNITRPKIPYFGEPPILLNEVQGEITYDL